MKRRTFLAITAQAIAGAALLAAAETQGQDAHGWRIGIYTRPWHAHDVEVALDAMVEAGYRYAGLMTCKKGLVIDVETKEKAALKIGEEAQARGLTILSVYGGQFYENGSKNAAIKGLRKLIDNVRACGGETLLLGGTGDKRAFDNYYYAVAACCDYARERHVVLTLKPHGGLNATGPQCRKIIEKVAHASFQLWYDPGNIFYYSDGQLDPTLDIESVADIVKGMCVKDFVPPKEVAVTPGAGRVDFGALFAKLVTSGFSSGPLVIECLDEGDLSSTLEQAKKARVYLEKLLVKVTNPQEIRIPFQEGV